MSSNFEDLFSSLQTQLGAELEGSRRAQQHPVAKGEASEKGWVNLLSDHLPNRYEVSSAFVIDSNGNTSDQIDVTIYDHQYTPIWYNKEGERFIPSESVYAAFEVKQSLNKENVEYAGDKALSVRELERTNHKIVHAGGEYDPRPLFEIVTGILTYDSEWNPPLGDSLAGVLNSLERGRHLNIGCAVSDGAFEVRYEGGGTEVIRRSGENTLVFFMLSLLKTLQGLGTVPAIDYDAYSAQIS